MFTTLKNTVCGGICKITIILTFLIILIFNSAKGQSTVKEYSDLISIELTTLSRQVNISDKSSVRFTKDIKSINDLFFNYYSEILNPLDSNDFDSDTQLMLDFKNYHQILYYYLNNSIPHNDTLLSFMKKDLEIKTSTDFALQTYSVSKRVTLRVKVMNEAQTKEIPGYHVFIRPYASLDPALKLSLNPTNNAVIDIRPGDKKVSIYLNNDLVEEREVPVYYKENDNTQTVIFIIR